MSVYPAPPISILTPLPPPLLEIDITGEWGPGYAVFFEDVLRMLCVQFTIQVMFYCSSDSGTASFLSAQFLLMLAYVILGVALYWLVLKRVLVFK